LCSAALLASDVELAAGRASHEQGGTLRNISDTIARLAAIRAKRGVQQSDDGSPGRLSMLTNFGSNPGNLNSKFYVPSELSAGAPLVVVLHGCTQNAAGYDHHSGWSKLADKEGFALLYPEQKRANNPNLCFNWFVPVDISRDGGEASSIRQMIDLMITTHEIDRRRVFITGLSAGGAMAGSMLASYPELFAGGAIIAGLPHGTASTIPEAFDRMRGHNLPSEADLRQLLSRSSAHNGPWPKISIWHGTSDRTVVPDNAKAIAAQWRGVHEVGSEETSELPGGHVRHTVHNTSGEAVIETNLISKMAHGTPLGRDGFGSAGPFMLQVGVSSTALIAAFWGIHRGGQIVRNEREATPSRQRDASSPSASKLEVGVSGTPASVESRVRKIIEDALRTAGLMK
jgi:poly(hydroxyalkanoate) depolymerase family esterase